MGAIPLNVVNAGPQPTFSAALLGVEITQAVQDMNHSVPLVADKATVVRVYLSPATHAGIFTVRGELEIRRTATGPATFVPSLDTAIIDPGAQNTVDACRASVARSLNFLLPQALTGAGKIFIRIGRVTDASSGNRVQLLPQGVQLDLTPTFLQSPPLRLRVIGLRYVDDAGSKRSPRAFDFSMLVSWLRRAYPVAEVVHTQIVLDANDAWPFTCNAANAQLVALRTLDVATGTDDRTHYLGLVSDVGGFMRGCASGIPVMADPSVVASAPSGVPGGSFGWDDDGSFADWYGGHELGHTFGRRHPGFCNQTADDPAFPFANGQLSNAGEFVGFDVGDATLGIPMKAMPGTAWHDVMTYCAQQWISAYTYEEIRQRLLSEDGMSGASAKTTEPPPVTNPVADIPAAAGPSPNLPTTASQTQPSPAGPTIEPAAPEPSPSQSNMLTMTSGPSSDGMLHIVARVDLTNGSGVISYVTPLPATRTQTQFHPTSDEVNVLLRLTSAQGRVFEYSVPVRLDSCSAEAGSDRTGLVDAIVPSVSDLGAIEIVHQATVLARTDLSHAEPKPPHASRMPPSLAPESMAAAGADPNRTQPVVLDWSNEHVEGLRYNVQVSDDQGATWQAIAVGRTEPRVSLDPDQFRSSRIRVRVTASNGRVTRDGEIEFEV